MNSVNSLVKVGILGATGFTGEKLVELLSAHPKVKLTYLSSRTKEPLPYSSLFPRFRGKVDVDCQPMNPDKAAGCCDLVFLALPHTVSMRVAGKFLSRKLKVIDLSADYRIKNPLVYKKYYKSVHQDKVNLKKAVYGAPEFFRKEIKKSSFISNPGCYPTAVILAAAPLLIQGLVDREFYVSAVSSITGAGRKPGLDFHYANVNDNMWAYKSFVHQHVPEMVRILEDLSRGNVNMNFVPHVAGIRAGIYSTLFFRMRKKQGKAGLYSLYKKFYGSEPFVRVREGLPRLSEVVDTNFCDIGISLRDDSREVVVCSCIDNLIKGAAGTAVHNMNIMCGFKETEGLSL